MTRDQILFESEIMENEKMTILDFEIMEHCFTENGEAKNKIGERLVTSIKTLIDKIREAIKNLQNKVVRKLKEDKFQRQLKKIRNSNLDKQVEFVDVWAFEKTFKAEVRALCNLCEEWEKNYNEKGASVSKANKFEEKYKGILDKYEPKLEKIKNTKVKVQTADVRKWLLLNTSPNGTPFGMLAIYIGRLEKCQKTLEDVKEKKDIFIDQTGYSTDAKAFTRFLHNSTIYVKRNADWLSMFAVSSLSLFAGWMIEKEDKKEIGKSYKPDHSEPEVAASEKKIYVNSVYRDSDYKSSKKKAASRARKGAVLGAAMGAYRKSKTDHRNSI